MQASSNSSLSKLQSILSRMSIQECCASALPELGLRWREVSRAVRENRLPMSAASIALVLRQHVAKTFSPDEVEQVLNILHLKSAIGRNRVWHTFTLLEPVDVLPPEALTMRLAGRIVQALNKTKTTKNIKPEVVVLGVGSMVYARVRARASLCAGAAVGRPLLFVSRPGPPHVLRALAEGLGYKSYENANLYGPEIESLLRIYNRNDTEIPEHLTEIPEYNPKPIVNGSGIDYTGRSYDEAYVDRLLGQNPPLLTDLQLTMTKPFFDSSRLNKMISFQVSLKSDNVAQTLKNWASKRALAPSSELFNIFHRMKSNQVVRLD